MPDRAASAVVLRDRLRAAARRVRVRSARARDQAVELARRYLPFESQHLFALTAGVGVVCGLVAVAFHLAIQWAESLIIDNALHAPGPSWIAWTIATPTVGGLLAGALLTWLAPGARGSGIPQVKAAFAHGGRVPFRDAFGKFWIAVLQIGSGASLGREGPTVQICAGAAGLLGRLTALPTKDTRRLLPVGVAAGIAAAFNAPVAAVTFTIEEIVGSLDHAVLSGVVVAAALAAVIERSVLGVEPIIEVQQQYGLDHPSSLALYSLLGVAAAGVSVLFTDGLLGLRARMKAVTVLPRWAHPAVGGLVTGVLAVAALELVGATGVTGGGYQTLGKALGGQLGLKVLLVLCLLKGVATVFSYSTGGAGGIFAPALFVGAMLGGVVGHADVALLGHEERQLGAFALVGMGAVFAGVIRAPITSVLIIFEMTGGYGLVLPLMLANMTSYVLARRARPTPIYEALLEQDGVVLPKGTTRAHLLDQLTVADAMTPELVSIAAGRTVGEARAQLGAPGYSVVPVLKEDRALVGVLPAEALATGSQDAKVESLARRAHTVLANESLARAAVSMNQNGVRQLLVLDAQTASHVVGIVSVSDLVRAHARAIPTGPGRRAEVLSTTELRELRAHELARPTGSVRGGASLEEVVRQMSRSAEDVLVVTRPDGSPGGAILLEHVREMLAEEQLMRMLVAADLARPLVPVPPDAGLFELCRASARGDIAGCLVEGTEEDPRVVTGRALGTVLLDWYVSSSRLE